MPARWLLAGLLLCTLTRAADLPPDLRRLTGLAASLPPEFNADTLLQIVEQHGGLDATIKRDLIQQAAALASQARNAYPKTAVHGISSDTRQAFEASALALKLDRLSLETRAVRDMLAFNPAEARHLFQQVQKPTPAPGNCRDALIPQLDDYYDLAAQMVSRGFTPKELDREEHVALLLQILGGVKAPHEVAPAARMLPNARLAPRQFEAALVAFTARLEAIDHDDHAFSETALATQTSIAALPRNATLARAYRKYLTTHYSAPRCGDFSGARITGTPTSSPIDWFNQSDLRGELPIIELKEVSAKDPQGKLQLDTFWTTPDSEKILVAAQSLRNSPGGVYYTASERNSSEWIQKLQDFLVQLSDWRQSGEESDLDFFHQKATVYESLIEVSPAGEGRQRLMNAFVDFLKSSQGVNSVDWFWHAQNIHHRLRQSGDGDAQKLVRSYKASGNLLLEVYAHLNGQ